MFVNNADLRAKLKQELKADADHIDFLPFGDLEQSVRDDVATLRASPLIPNDVNISGFIDDVKSGKLSPVT
jgi:carbonic anhydrase